MSDSEVIIIDNVDEQSKIKSKVAKKRTFTFQEININKKIKIYRREGIIFDRRWSEGKIITKS